MAKNASLINGNIVNCSGEDQNMSFIYCDCHPATF
jgi:hypothetical protein